MENSICYRQKEININRSSIEITPQVQFWCKSSCLCPLKQRIPKAESLYIQRQSWVISGIKCFVWILVFACFPHGQGGRSGVFLPGRRIPEKFILTMSYCTPCASTKQTDRQTLGLYLLNRWAQFSLTHSSYLPPLTTAVLSTEDNNNKNSNN